MSLKNGPPYIVDQQLTNTNRPSRCLMDIDFPLSTEIIGEVESDIT